MHKTLHKLFVKLNKPTNHFLTFATECGEQTDPVQLSKACMQLHDRKNNAYLCNEAFIKKWLWSENEKEISSCP